jgi:hypothetical protein
MRKSRLGPAAVVTRGETKDVTHVVPHQTWSEYFDAATRELAGAPVTIEITPVDDPSVMEATSLSLKLLNYDRRDDVFTVAAADGSSRSVSGLLKHLEHPERVVVDNHTLLTPITITVEGRGGAGAVIRIERRSERPAERSRVPGQPSR